MSGETLQGREMDRKLVSPVISVLLLVVVAAVARVLSYAWYMGMHVPYALK